MHFHFTFDFSACKNIHTYIYIFALSFTRSDIHNFRFTLHIHVRCARSNFPIFPSGRHFFKRFVRHFASTQLQIVYSRCEGAFNAVLLQLFAAKTHCLTAFALVGRFFCTKNVQPFWIQLIHVGVASASVCRGPLHTAVAT